MQEFGSETCDILSVHYVNQGVSISKRVLTMKEYYRLVNR